MIALILALTMAGDASRDSLLGERVEGIAAVVGGELVLRSDVDGVLAYELQQRTTPAADDSTRDALRAEILQQLIEDRLLLNYAKQETISVTTEEIDTSLQQRIEQIRSRFPSESSFMVQLETEGLDMARFRELQRRVVEEQLIKSRLQQRLQSEWRIQVSEAEILRFCAERANEIPDTPERVELHHILLKTGPPAAVLASEDSLLGSLRARIVGGESFEDLARRYSQDASASLGGDLGFFVRGSMVPEFEVVLDQLQPGQTSGVVETRFGLHLIQLAERNERGFRARHIIRLLPQLDDPSSLEPVIAEIRAQRDTTALGDLAARYSADTDTKGNGGRLGIVVPSTLEVGPLASLLDTLPEMTLSPPLVDNDGVHLYWIARRIPEGKPPCEEIMPGIRDLLMAEKGEAKLKALLEELRNETYIEVFD